MPKSVLHTAMLSGCPDSFTLAGGHHHHPQITMIKGTLTYVVSTMECGRLVERIYDHGSEIWERLPEITHQDIQNHAISVIFLQNPTITPEILKKAQFKQI